MAGQNWIFNWKSTLSAIAFTAGTFGIGISSPAEAIPANRGGFKLAQVGVRSRINSPTPLNLRPQTHIPLPTNSRSYRHRDGGGYSRNPRHDDYGYGHYHHGNGHHHSHHRSKSRRGGTVIIINPSNSSYSNHRSRGSYIRINSN